MANFRAKSHTIPAPVDLVRPSWCKTLILSRDLGTWRVWHKGLGNMLRFRSNKDIHDAWLTQIPADRVRASARPISDFGPISEVTRGGDDDIAGK